MEANMFISKLKADGSKNDLTNLDEVFGEYKDTLAKLASKDRGTFALNVLCILCRNLEKIPSWRAQINYKSLLALSIECVRETRSLATAERVKTLACVYHVHRHIVGQSTSIPPEMILKLSYMPFETELLTDYCKTYWNLLADRILYIEKLKTKVSISKLLPKLIEDSLHVIKIYNTVQFCQNILTFLIKKLHFLFCESDSSELNKIFGQIYNEISSKADLKHFKKLSEKEALDIYNKLQDCLYVVAENSSRYNLESSSLNTVVQTNITLLGHCPDILHCFQTVYLNGICSVLTNNNTAYVETILSNLRTTCETTEKLGYKKTMTATYPYLNQLLRLYIDHTTSKTKKVSEQNVENTLKLMLFLMKKLETSEQLLKCENCSVKTGLHDALRLSLLVKNLITASMQESFDISKALPIYLSIILAQYDILKQLCVKGCNNYDKCYRKLQSDVHNTAINLNKAKEFDFSIKLFDIYLKNEIIHFKNKNDMKNISRALYNKSICELDCKQYENAIVDAYLSLIFAYPEGLSAEKYMSLVMDIKAKVLKSKDDETGDDEETDDLMMMTVVDACAMAIDAKRYGNLKPFFCDLKFSSILHHEFCMYAKLWPSIVPVAGVWKALHDLTQHDVPWLSGKDDSIRQTLYDVILQTPTAVRTIHNDHFAEIVTELLEDFENDPPKTVEHRIVQATLLFFKSEYKLTEASIKYNWKVEPNADPDQVQAMRTISQEHEALKEAITAVEVWSEIVEELDIVALTPSLRWALQTAEVFVPQLLHLYRTLHGLQLAHICCVIADYVEDRECYLRNASIIVYHASKQTIEVTNIIAKGSGYCAKLIQNTETMETAIGFLCDCAIYYSKIKLSGLSAKLVRSAQTKVLGAMKNNPDIKLDLAIGRLLEAQIITCADSASPSVVGATTSAHRHYLVVVNNATKWTARQLRSLTLKLRITSSGLTSCVAWRRLLSWRRARAACAASLPAAPAPAHARLLAAATNTHLMEDAQIKIDNRLKYILGLQPSTDQPINQISPTKSHHLFTPKQELETMLENMTFKKTQISPSLPCLSVPGFKIPEFLKHSQNCSCYACDSMYALILSCETMGLEASMYYRAKEYDIAKNYFDGALKCLLFTENKLKISNKHKKIQKYLVDITEALLLERFKETQLQILIENAFFEMAQENFKMADEKIVEVHIIMQESNVNTYLRNEVLNLIMASAKLKKEPIKAIDMTILESELESLKLSPTEHVEAPKTPETKAEKPPKITKIKVKDEEVPNTKRRVIKLNLDENGEEKESNTKTRTSKRTQFKIPVPEFKKPVLESITPTPRRKNPEIVISQAETNSRTPKPSSSKENCEFFTPIQTPSEQFFTPMSTLKTYKKSLRQGIVKNLEQEFATPKSDAKTDITNFKMADASKMADGFDKENKRNASVIPKKVKAKVETGSLKEKKTLTRTTSPGKFDKNEIKPRSSRLRQLSKLSVDDGEK